VVDLAGLAISSDIGGITIEGGLRKFGDGDTVQYVGMLLGRFGVYGLSVFGGYGHGVESSQRYGSFFAFGAVSGPIGGPRRFSSPVSAAGSASTASSSCRPISRSSISIRSSRRSIRPRGRARIRWRN
jgi:hypothetical protein